jgi:hypothetical protein
MTALCGGGISSARPQFGAATSVGIAEIAALLNNVPTPTALAVAGVIGLLQFELTTFCTVDPPAMPTFTAQDYIDVLNFTDVLTQANAISKFKDALGNVLWPTLCQCDSTSTPAAPTWPTPPTNLPTVNPPQLPNGPSSATCWDRQVTWQFTGFPNVPVDATNLMWSDPNPFPGYPTVATRNFQQPVPTQVEFRLFVVTNDPSNPITAMMPRIDLLDSTGSQIKTVQGTDGGGNDQTVTIQTTSATTAVRLIANFDDTDSSGAQNATVGARLTMTCGNALLPTQPCCPPDPSLSALLSTVLSYVQSIYASIPTPLNSYATATVHSGLTGNGTVTLADNAIAVRVDITTDDNGGFIPGDPEYLIDRGFIVPVINQGPIRSTVRLVYNPQVYILPALTEQVGYSLHVGVTASITELIAGP